jgi:hypothetical protein
MKKGSDFYFAHAEDELIEGGVYTIVPKKYWDKNKRLLDENQIAADLLPNGFFELSEGMYEYDGKSNEGKELLINAGFIENSELISSN